MLDWQGTCSWRSWDLTWPLEKIVERVLDRECWVSDEAGKRRKSRSHWRKTRYAVSNV